MRRLRRSLVLVRPTARFVEWLNAAIEDEGFDEDEVCSDCSAYLVPAVEGEAGLEPMLQRHYAEIFERELQDWVTDTNRWPGYRGYSVFEEFFTVTLATAVRDLAD